MITAVCMNPAFDKAASVKRFRQGQVNRLENIRCGIGGKGLNVAIVLKRLGATAGCVGVLGDGNRTAFLEAVAFEALPFFELSVPGQIRTNMKVLDQETGVTTEYNEPGPLMTQARREQLLSLLRDTAKSGYVVLSGSLPGGCPPSAYREIIQALPGRKCVLDAEGESLRQGIAANPFLVKPNLPELEALAQRPLHTLEEIKSAAFSLRRRGAEHVMVSLGGRGALLLDGQTAVFSPGLTVEAKATVGAGDAFLAGVLLGLDRGECLREAFRMGMAAGTASVMAGGPRQVNGEDFAEVLEKVMLREL